MISFRISTRNRRASPVLGCLLVAIIFTLMGGIALLFIAPPYLKAQNYAQAQCQIVSKEMLSKRGSKGSRTYQAEFTYRVQLPNGQQFQNSGYGLSSVWTNDRGNVQNILNRYEVGSMYSCWYDPADPTHAVLNKDLSMEDGSLILLLVFGGFFAVGSLLLVGMIGVVIWGIIRRKI